MSKIFKLGITGTGGFVGKHVATSAREASMDVLCVSSQLAPGSENDVIACGDGAGGVDYSRFNRKVDAMIHMAARVHVLRDTAKDPLSEFRKVNVDQTLALAGRCMELGVSRFVFVSSIHVNGRSSEAGLFHPDDRPWPRSDYARSKHEAELALRDLVGSSMELVIVRPPLIYGPGVKANFYRLMRLVESGLPLPLAAVHNRRSFLAVRNFADFLLAAASGGGGHGRVYLPADREVVSTPGLIRSMAGAMGRKARLFPVWPPLLKAGAALAGRPGLYEQLCQSSVVDSTACERDFGWRPPFSQARMLAETVNWYQAQAGR